MPDIYSGPRLTFPLDMDQAADLVEAFKNKQVSAPWGCTKKYMFHDSQIMLDVFNHVHFWFLQAAASLSLRSSASSGNMEVAQSVAKYQPSLYVP